MLLIDSPCEDQIPRAVLTETNKRRNTMSECQVRAVEGPEKSMMEPQESMKDGGTGQGLGQDAADRVKGGERAGDNGRKKEREWSAAGHELTAQTRGRVGLEK